MNRRSFLKLLPVASVAAKAVEVAPVQTKPNQEEMLMRYEAFFDDFGYETGRVVYEKKRADCWAGKWLDAAGNIVEIF